MNAEHINTLLSNVVRCETELDKMAEMLGETEKELQLQNTIYDFWWVNWDRNVLTTGQAFAEAEKEYGAGWQRDFDTLGYSVCYTVACSYIACARHPEAADGVGITSVEEWAKASAKLDRAADEKTSKKDRGRKQSVAGRKSKNVKKTECVESNRPVGASDQAVQPPQPASTAKTNAAKQSIANAPAEPNADYSIS